MKQSLKGEWQFETLDTIILPSTTEQSCKGNGELDKTQVLHLSRKYPFKGVSCYKRTVEIPKEWGGKYIELFLERTKFTKVWVDGSLVTQSYETIIPQRHDLSRHLTPGKHEISIEVDNDLAKYDHFPESLYNGHQYTEHTQTNWNGIIGEIYLEAKELIRVANIRIMSESVKRQFTAELTIENILDEQNIIIEINGAEQDSKHPHTLESAASKFKVKTGENTLTVVYESESPFKLWDEFNPCIYELVFSVKSVDEAVCYDTYKVKTGFVQVKVQDKAIKVNDIPVFLRGNVDCALFPVTGAPPMDTESWERLFEVMKSYGMNHHRFHSWCPPRAAFEAADKIGIYLQPELSCFANGLYTEGHEKEDKVLKKYLYDQGIKLLKEFGNHPSFILFAIGNEMVGELEPFEDLIRAYRACRPDKLYAQGSNNFLEDPVCTSEDDYWVIMRTTKTDNIRASFAHSDLPLGHLQTFEKPGTMKEYSKALAHSHIPLIAHEIGQYQVYPNYQEIQKYIGVFYPTALDVFKERLEAKGLGHLADAYFKASGKLAALCYREDIEALMRTEGMTGFQLLGLQDFSGQGTALIGMLDSFFDSKGIITDKSWREFCSSQVLLAKLSKYTFTIGEPVELEVLFYNFGREDVQNQELKVVLRTGKDKIDCCEDICVSAPRGALTTVQKVILHTESVKECTKGEILLTCGEITNRYPVWFYPNQELEQEQDIFITEKINEEAAKVLQKGGNVLLLSSNVAEAHSVEGFFASDFWCYPMFKKACEDKGLKTAPGTLGILCDKDHPSLKDFPTESYSEWQWHQIVMHSRPIILDGADKNLSPIVQVIDNFERNHKLGLLFEAKVLNGKLLVCASDILGNIQQPEVKQLYNSLVRYAKGKDFNPSITLDIAEVTKWMNS